MNANPHEILQWLVSWTQLIGIFGRGASSSIERDDVNEAGESTCGYGASE